jgi:hypothetical protein
MDPTMIRIWQSAIWAVACLLPALLFGREGAELVALSCFVAGACWIWLMWRYEGKRHGEISPERAEGDMAMKVNGVLGLLIPLLLAALVAAFDLEPLLHPAGVAASLSVPLLAILLSSAVDWYVILPFRDGVIDLPACRIDEVDLATRRRYTKLWVAHRLACEMTIATALVVVVVLLLAQYIGNFEEIVTIVGALGIPAVLVVIAGKRWFRGGLRFCLAQGPALGDWVKGPTYTKREGEKIREGFVVDVSLDNGLKIAARPGGTEHFIALVDAIPDISDRDKAGYACTPDLCRAWLRIDPRDSSAGVSCEIHRLRRQGRMTQTVESAEESA